LNDDLVGHFPISTVSPDHAYIQTLCLSKNVLDEFLPKWVFRMSEIPKIFTSEWYDYKYFADAVGKSFRRPNGSIEHWGYRNPSGTWEGCRPIAEVWKKIFNPKNMLDVGAGRGQFIAAAREVGIEAEGFDFSEWAVNEGRVKNCKAEWLRLHDATKPWPYPDRSFDLVTALDFFEHLYVDDIPFVIDEMYRVAKKWIFLQIAVVGGGSGYARHEKGYILKKGEPIPLEFEANAVAGHVTVVDKSTWEGWLERDGWLARRDMVNYFYALVDPSIVRNWVHNFVAVYERVA
jgi:hypothetical protein